jgi:3-oxoacyl-[acyl-carrier-protein] synthase II
MSGRVPVVTGTGVICSVGGDSEGVWQSLVLQKSGLAPLSLFPSSRYGQSPVAEVTADLDSLCGAAIRGSRTDKLAYLAVRQALADAKLNGAGADLGDRVGVVLGTTVGGVLGTERLVETLLRGKVREYGRLRYHECAAAADLCAAAFGCLGPTATVSTACSGGAMAIALAGRLIETGAADIVIAGGADSLCRLTVNGFGSLLLLDANGCRPFDRNRAGINLGEGAAVLIVESAESAARRGVRPLARLAGWGCSCDAFHATAPDAEGGGAYRAMSEALRRAGVEPALVDHINAHGTGTPGNDLAESKAIRRLFGDRLPPVLSTKGLLGHTLGASGAIDAVLCIKALEHGGPPPSPGFETADPDIGFAPVQAAANKPQTHVVDNAFGFGGNNVSLVFSAATAPVASSVSPSGSCRLAIAGVGLVGAMGSRTEDVFAGSAASGAPWTWREIAAPLPPARVGVYACPDEFGAKEEINAVRRRKLERVQMMSLVAARRCRGSLAMEALAGERTCVAMGTGLGASIATAAFVEPVIADESAAPSPQRFTNAVHNALASQVAIEFTARGLNSTVTHREISFEAALWHAQQEIEAGNADYALAGGADELTPYVLSAGLRWGWWGAEAVPLRPLAALSGRHQAMPGEGAAMFCLGRAGAVPDALAEVVAVSFGRYATDPSGGIAAEREVEWIERELAARGVSLRQVDVILTGANGVARLDAMYTAVARRLGAAIPHGCYKHLCGEYHTASAFGMAVAAGLVSKRIVPAALLVPDSDYRVALLYTLSPGGTRALVCVARPGA